VTSKVCPTTRELNELRGSSNLSHVVRDMDKDCVTIHAECFGIGNEAAEGAFDAQQFPCGRFGDSHEPDSVGSGNLIALRVETDSRTRAILFRSRDLHKEPLREILREGSRIKFGLGGVERNSMAFGDPPYPDRYP